MPTTKFQSFIFTLIMVFCMVFSMTTYTIALNMGDLTYQVFSLAIREMWVEYVVVFLLIFFVVSPSALKLARIHFTPGQDKPIFMMVSIQCATVCLIVPMITLFATFYHNGFEANWFCQWIRLAASCFPVALCLQVFFIGPFVRMVFRHIFHKQLAKQPHH